MRPFTARRSVALAALFAVGGALVLASCAPAPNVHWLLYGDSLSEQSGPYLSLFGSVGNRYFGGTAPCDWVDTLGQDSMRWQPQEVLIQFSGNQLTPCSQGDGFSIYYKSVAEIASYWTSHGVKVVIVISPRRPDDSEAFARHAELLVAANLHVTVDRADQAVLNNGSFTYFLPCTSSTEDGCGTDPMGGTPQPGMVRVRAPDGTHFALSSADGYSSGALRFATAEATG